MNVWYPFLFECLFLSAKAFTLVTQRCIDLYLSRARGRTRFQGQSHPRDGEGACLCHCPGEAVNGEQRR